MTTPAQDQPQRELLRRYGRPSHITDMYGEIPAPRWDLVPTSLSPEWQPSWSTGHLVNAKTDRDFLRELALERATQAARDRDGLDRATDALGTARIPSLLVSGGGSSGGGSPSARNPGGPASTHEQHMRALFPAELLDRVFGSSTRGHSRSSTGAPVRRPHRSH